MSDPHDVRPQPAGLNPSQAIGPLQTLDPSDRDPAAAHAFDQWMQLHTALAFEPEHALALLELDGDPGRALARGALSPPHSARSLAAVRKVLTRHGVTALPITSRDYPVPLRALADPPALVFVRGNTQRLVGRLVGVVGARAATVYGLDMARQLGRRLARAGVTVVSGLARGIDAAAHRGALEAGGDTIAVQACGPDRTYPAEHRSLAREIARCGAVISEFPVGTPPRPPYFPLRNRVISGLSCAVIVVEARERSGSLITTRHAADQGRDVLALPGPITAPTSGGPNRLIRDGAVPIVDLDEVVELLGFESPAEPSEDAEVQEERETARVGEGGVRILRALARGGLHRDELARRVGARPEQLDLDLVGLQLQGRIARDRDGRLVEVGGARRRADDAGS
ncbi:MAG: DNA-processing protein DprA [Myxococcota bacterium]|nr:DNA-processing protein DprA [Myxococcota bacterium]